ncbi:unnamed protein product, partial [Effrenium voratum]
ERPLASLTCCTGKICKTAPKVASAGSPIEDEIEILWVAPSVIDLSTSSSPCKWSPAAQCETARRKVKIEPDLHKATLQVKVAKPRKKAVHTTSQRSTLSRQPFGLGRQLRLHGFVQARACAGKLRERIRSLFCQGWPRASEAATRESIAELLGTSGKPKANTYLAWALRRDALSRQPVAAAILSVYRPLAIGQWLSGESVRGFAMAEWHTPKAVQVGRQGDAKIARLRSEREALRQQELEELRRRENIEKAAQEREHALLSEASAGEAANVAETSALRERMAEIKDAAEDLLVDADQRELRFAEDCRHLRADRLDVEKGLREEAKKLKEISLQIDEVQACEEAALQQQEQLLSQRRAAARQQRYTLLEETQRCSLEMKQELMKELGAVHEELSKAKAEIQKGIVEEVLLRQQVLRAVGDDIQQIDQDVNRGLEEAKARARDLQERAQHIIKETQLAAQIYAALGAQGLGPTLRRWRPALLQNFLTPEAAAAAVRSELLGPEASWHRTSLEPPEEPKLAAERRYLERVAKAADARTADSLGLHEDLANVSCIGEPQNGRPRPADWGPLAPVSFEKSDRLKLEKPAGFVTSELGEVHFFSKKLKYIPGPDFEAFGAFGPSPRMPCLARLLRVLAAPETLEKLQGVLASRLSLEPFLIRIYQYNRPYHYTCPHTDEMAVQVFDLNNRSHDMQSVLSLNVNLGGDVEPSQRNGGLVWCTPRPRWLPAPLGSAGIFRISNHSWHAVLPGRSQPTGVRLTIQVVYAAETPASGMPQAFGFDQSEHRAVFKGDQAASAAQGFGAAEGRCHDSSGDCDENWPTEDRMKMEGCKGGELLHSICCASCEQFWEERFRVVAGLENQVQATAVFLRSALPRFSRRLSEDVTMPLLALGTGGMSGRRAADVIAFALRCGFRHLDSAAIYPSFPDQLSAGLAASGVSRREVFLTTKVPTTAMGFAAAWAHLRRMKDELPGGYADLCMVHWPQPDQPAPPNTDPVLWEALERAGTWRALEEAHAMGVCRTLGVSNYMVKHLEELLRYAKVRPVVNQVEYSPKAPLLDLLDFCQQERIAISAFAWNRPEVLLQQELVTLAEELQPPKVLERNLLMTVLMRWFMAQGMVPLFRSEREENILAMARSLELPELSEAQVAFLRRSDANYPWKYYKNQPWNAVVLGPMG